MSRQAGRHELCGRCQFAVHWTNNRLQILLDEVMIVIIMTAISLRTVRRIVTVPIVTMTILTTTITTIVDHIIPKVTLNAASNASDSGKASILCSKWFSWITSSRSARQPKAAGYIRSG